ncbi:MAG: hypothetical protein HS101_16045 [Planctomycetia bacterium]|nr:hypothetical protein [Planctomycetia bacterium]MCC7315141.1 hypothetical protein [Planctomycetota bacterium]OQY96243.1 MAG: hypothetical protein B6D36_19665 [Planctomycetes bacterium UTPLA1]
MKWHDKLDRLLRDRNVSAISRAVGLHPGRLGTQVALRQMPRADRAVKLARQLGVDTDWLFDDTKDWPPHHVEVGPTPFGSVESVGKRRAPARMKARSSVICYRILPGKFDGARSLQLLGATQQIEPEDFCGQKGLIPVVAPIAAGEPKEAHDNGFPVGVADAYVAFECDDPNAFGLSVDGASMEPDFRHGDIIIASPKFGQSNGTLRDGMVAVVIFGPERTATFKRVRLGTMGKRLVEPLDYVLEPLNPHFPPMRLKTREVSAIHPVIGLVRREVVS